VSFSCLASGGLAPVAMIIGYERSYLHIASSVGGGSAFHGARTPLQFASMVVNSLLGILLAALIVAFIWLRTHR